MESFLHNIVCIIAYDGSKFCGFSTQKHKLDSKGYISIADFFTYTLTRIGINTKIIAAGRTDKGVHATFQVINFFTDSKMPLNKMKGLLNNKLFPNIFIRKMYYSSLDFHARFSAKSRTYRYIFTQNDLLPFFTNYISKVKCGDLDSIKQALNEFIGVHDFTLFKKLGSPTKNNIREIYNAKIFTKNIYNIPCFIIKINANGFLRSQVRLIIQACLNFSLGKISLENLQKQINNNLDINDKVCVRTLAPACGLYLCRVEY